MLWFILGVVATLAIEFFVVVVLAVKSQRKGTGINSIERMGETIHAVRTNQKGEKHAFS